MIWATLLLQAAATSWASPPCPQPENLPVKLDSQLLGAIESMGEPTPMKPWHSASDEDVLDARCSRSLPFSVKEMTGWLDAQAAQSGKKADIDVHGIQLQDESPYMAGLLRALLTNSFWMRDPQPRFTSTCKKAYCAAKEIFGDPVGVQLLFMLGRYGHNGSHLRVSNASLWRKDELDDMLLALSDLPDSLIPAKPLEYNKQLVHYTRGVNAEDRALANSSIQVYDDGSAGPPPERRRTLFHELGHNAQANLDFHNPDWYKVAGWTQVGRDWTQADKTKSASGYGEMTPKENFAEDFTAYRFNPEKLKSANPKSYELFKSRVFNGTEYSADASCRNPHPESAELISTLKSANQLAAQGKIKLADWEIQEAMAGCRQTLAASLSTHTLLNEASRCVRPLEIQRAMRTQGHEGIHPNWIRNFIQKNPDAAPSAECRENCTKLAQSALRKVSRTLTQAATRWTVQDWQQTLSPERYCADWTRSSLFIAIRDSDPNEDPFELEREARTEAKRVCLAVQSKFPDRRRNMSAEQIDAALKELHLSP